MGRRSYVGNAGATTLASDITAASTSIAVVDATNWPSPTGGTVAVAIIGRGAAGEEKITFSGRTGNTLTGCVRGFDSTSAATHVSGATIEHGLSATDMDEANDHVFDTTNDDHTQYLNNTRHDVTARHTFGAGFATPSAPPVIGFTGVSAAGSAAGPSRSDHGHGYNPPACRVYHSTTQALSDGVEASITFDSERFDTDSMHSTVSNASRITMTTAGLYHVCGHLELAAAADYSLVLILLRVNGTLYIAGSDTQGNAVAVPQRLTVSAHWKFAAGDYVELRAYQDNTGSASRNAAAASGTNAMTEFSAVWVGVG